MLVSIFCIVAWVLSEMSPAFGDHSLGSINLDLKAVGSNVPLSLKKSFSFSALVSLSMAVCMDVMCSLLFVGMNERPNDRRSCSGLVSMWLERLVTLAILSPVGRRASNCFLMSHV